MQFREIENLKAILALMEESEACGRPLEVQDGEQWLVVSDRFEYNPIYNYRVQPAQVYEYRIIFQAIAGTKLTFSSVFSDLEEARSHALSVDENPNGFHRPLEIISLELQGNGEYNVMGHMTW